jgi:hypothetical protein
MGPKEKQKIEIEKLHRDPLPPLNQALTADYSDFLGTALIRHIKTAFFISCRGMMNSVEVVRPSPIQQLLTS